MKYALVIGNSVYEDATLAQLSSPTADTQALSEVLRDPRIGDFNDVILSVDEAESQIRRKISAFFSGKKPDDLLLLYFSGHGMLDERGHLYLAVKDTLRSILHATAIPAEFITDEMDGCRSKRQVLVLDCCYGGAFDRRAKGELQAVTQRTFQGAGFGRAVLTASDSTQFALEGEEIKGKAELSLFTHYLIEGLKSGEADRDEDGVVTLDEWYDYCFEQVVSQTPKQTPCKWTYNQKGDLVIAKNPSQKLPKPVELPVELGQAIESPYAGVRTGAVAELGRLLSGQDEGLRQAAKEALEKLQGDDSKSVSMAVKRLLSNYHEQNEKSTIRLDIDTQNQSALNVASTKTITSETSKEEVNTVAETPVTTQPDMVAKPILLQSPAESSHPQETKIRQTFESLRAKIRLWVILIFAAVIFFLILRSLLGSKGSPTIPLSNNYPTTMASASVQSMAPTAVIRANIESTATLPPATATPNSTNTVAVAIPPVTTSPFAVSATPTSLAVLKVNLPTPNATQIKEMIKTGGKLSIMQVKWSPDGKDLAFATSNGIYLLDAVTLQQLRFIEAGYWVDTIVFSSDGQQLASGGADNTVRIWDMRTGNLIQTMEGILSGVKSISFSPDGKQLVSGSWFTMKIWDIASGKPLKTFNEYQGPVVYLAFSPDGTQLATGSTKDGIIIWDTQNWQVQRRLNVFVSDIYTRYKLAFSPDGTELASGSWNAVRVWDARSGKLLQIISDKPMGTVNGVAYSPDGKRLASGGNDNIVRLWDTQNWKLLQSLSGQTANITDVEFSPDGTQLIAGSFYGNEVSIWETASGKLLKIISTQ